MLTAAVSAFQEQARAQKPTPPASPTPQPARERLPSSPVREVGAFIRFAHESLTPWRRPSQLSTPWMGSRPVLLGAPRAALLSARGGGAARCLGFPTSLLTRLPAPLCSPESASKGQPVPGSFPHPLPAALDPDHTPFQDPRPRPPGRSPRPSSLGLSRAPCSPEALSLALPPQSSVPRTCSFDPWVTEPPAPLPTAGSPQAPQAPLPEQLGPCRPHPHPAQPESPLSRCPFHLDVTT